MNKFKFLLLLVLLPSYLTVFSQDQSGYLMWSPNRKLTVDDFTIKAKQQATSPSFGQFSFDFQIKGLDIFSKSY